MKKTFLAVSLLLSAALLLACTCKDNNFSFDKIPQEYKSYSRIFLGKLLAQSGSQFRMEVIENFKNTVQGEVILGTGGTGCDWLIKTPGYYLIYGRHLDFGDLEVSLCSPSKMLEKGVYQQFLSIKTEQFSPEKIEVQYDSLLAEIKLLQFLQTTQVENIAERKSSNKWTVGLLFFSLMLLAGLVAFWWNRS
ncbi:MAG: hypothetical protein AB8G15_23240 [Saprospiraceae bacterium]